MVSLSPPEIGVVGLVAVTLILTGPIPGVIDVTAGNPTTVGDGTAAASVTGLDTTAFVIEDGRFGTGVSYLRIPTATVAVSDVEGRPRLVYRVQLPALGIDAVTTELLTAGQRGTVRLNPRDRGIDPGQVTNDSYTATVTVRTQSFERDETVYSTTVSVEVVS